MLLLLMNVKVVRAFQLTEHDISNPSELKLIKESSDYDWSSDHFNRPAYLTYLHNYN